MTQQLIVPFNVQPNWPAETYPAYGIAGIRGGFKDGYDNYFNVPKPLTGREVSIKRNDRGFWEWHGPEVSRPEAKLQTVSTLNQPATTRFVFKDGFPTEVMQTVRTAFLAEEWLVPDWCQHVMVCWDGDGDSDATMRVNMSYAYRWAHITVYPAWLTSHNRREAVLHELTHIVIAPLALYTEDTLDELLKDDAPKFCAHTRKQAGDRIESVVQDLTALLQRKTASTVSLAVTELPPAAT